MKLPSGAIVLPPNGAATYRRRSSAWVGSWVHVNWCCLVAHQKASQAFGEFGPNPVQLPQGLVAVFLLLSSPSAKPGLAGVQHDRG